MNASSKTARETTVPTPDTPTTSASTEAAGGKSPLGRFGRLPELAGAGFLPLGLFARLPVAMLTVGALALVQAVGQSYAIGGYAAGAVGVGSAIGSPVLGYLADRSGQRPVLLLSALANTAATVGLIAVTFLVPDFSTASILLILVAALMTGMTCPQVGPMARVRWMALAGRSPKSGDLETAMSYESTADELTFVMGPALVGLLAAVISPWLPLALAALITITLVCAFAVHPTHHAVVPSHKISSLHPSVSAADSGASPAQWWPVSIPVLGMVCMGTFFGGTQTALFAFAGTGSGTASVGGLLYSVMGLSSAAAALSVAYWPAGIRNPVRWLVSAAAMAVLTLLLFLPEATVPMLLALFALGITVGPTMVTIFSLGGEVAPPARLGTVMTMLASGIVAGTAIGSAIAGNLAENIGHTIAFAVPTAAATGLLVLGLVALAGRRAPEREPQRS